MRRQAVILDQSFSSLTILTSHYDIHINEDRIEYKRLDLAEDQPAYYSLGCWGAPVFIEPDR